ncbi:response regulator transcription factor [Cohnella fermenti]|uniref:Response regulator transcription factor n=1 Tax=Cohnella fermenti TaxID=2565925 RepID=A0A4S4CEW9_9BACL|nr:response regulator transcription factor [Cohnella fermenti]THF84555.1 response regulator transcription factor [Cohnella fermenti]
MQSILIVEDEDAIARVLAAYLRRAGYRPQIVSDGSEALSVFAAWDFSLVLLDVMLPGMDGWEVLRAIRDRSPCPVIMLTAKGDLQDRLAGLNDGADDYMTKPFVPDEVVARVRAALRRRPHWTDGESKRHFGNLMLDFASKSVFLNAAEVSLNPRELALLLFLAESPNRIFTREQLIEHVWGNDYDGSERAVDLAVKRLRQALANWPAEAGEIRTLRGTGYQLWIGE